MIKVSNVCVNFRQHTIRQHTIPYRTARVTEYFFILLRIFIVVILIVSIEISAPLIAIVYMGDCICPEAPVVPARARIAVRR